MNDKENAIAGNGKMRPMAFVYHPQHGQKLVDCEAVRTLMKQGWYDSPANFPSAVEQQAMTILPLLQKQHIKDIMAKLNDKANPFNVQHLQELLVLEKESNEPRKELINNLKKMIEKSNA